MTEFTEPTGSVVGRTDMTSIFQNKNIVQGHKLYIASISQLDPARCTGIKILGKQLLVSAQSNLRLGSRNQTSRDINVVKSTDTTI